MLVKGCVFLYQVADDQLNVMRVFIDANILEHPPFRVIASKREPSPVTLSQGPAASGWPIGPKRRSTGLARPLAALRASKVIGQLR